eukprot:TRINITY_DN102749_c0_g1_i1.p1 TRINITY_DN102749_c0_g1~~TRINITY_DN102749_c0_g1_i1.p1  ORF type:complete len:400 (+),score=55.70 TRINITY_DN102749_c0_g1_i1:100-1299(+)
MDYAAYGAYGTPCQPESPRRHVDWVKFLPVAFVWSIILGLWAIYTFLHLVPQMNSGSLVPGTLAFNVQMVFFNLVTVLLWACFIMCSITSPGTTPNEEEDPSWQIIPMDPCATSMELGEGLAVFAQETKKSGLRRTCKWCKTYKPDRAHHCRACQMCVLKMDHHCPWIYNCVGFRNHKYFFLLLLYCALDTQIISWTMSTSLSEAVRDPQMPFLRLFLLLFGETLACFMCFLVTSFFGFHIWLMLKALTTIDYCEKSQTGSMTSAYDRGAYANITAVLGDNPLLWLLPVSMPSGDGLTFARADADPSLDWRGLPKSSSDSLHASRGAQEPVFMRRGRSPGAGTGEAPNAGSECGGSEVAESDSEAKAGSAGSRETPGDTGEAVQGGGTPPPPEPPSERS